MSTLYSKIVLNAEDRTKAGFGSAKRGLTSISTQLDKVHKQALAFVSLQGAVRVGLGLQGVADDYTKLNNQLRVNTDHLGDLAGVQKTVFDLSRVTRTEVDGLGSFYARLAKSTKTLTSDQSLLGVATGTVTKALRIEGNTGAETSSLLLQLSQAFRKGKLDGDEFKTVTEASSTVQELLAKQLGITVGELKEYSEEGKITTQVMLDAFVNGAAEVGAKFLQMEKTIGDGAIVIANSFERWIGKTDDALEASSALTDTTSLRRSIPAISLMASNHTIQMT